MEYFATAGLPCFAPGCGMGNPIGGHSFPCIGGLVHPNRLCLSLKHHEFGNQNCTVFRLFQVRFH